jgi:CRP-like cAMP-binding protein
VVAASERAAGTGLSFSSGLDAAESAEFERRGVRRRFARGAALFHEHQLADRVLVLLDGRVKITTLSGDGKETILAVCGVGDLIGEQAALDARPRSASAIALEPVEALAFPAADFCDLIANSPRTAALMTRVLNHRLRETSRTLAQFGTADAVGRVAARLVDLAERYGEPNDDEIRIALALSQEELACWVGASREAICKALKTLRCCGWVHTERRSITILDLEALRRRAT